MSLFTVVFAAALLPMMALSISGVLFAAEWLGRRSAPQPQHGGQFERLLSA